MFCYPASGCVVTSSVWSAGVVLSSLDSKWTLLVLSQCQKNGTVKHREAILRMRSKRSRRQKMDFGEMSDFVTVLSIILMFVLLLQINYLEIMIE